MKDVARAVGVSQATVSLVINDVATARVSKETRAQIWRAVEELGYKPNEVARGLRQARTNTIGFISDEIATTPFAGSLVQGGQDAAWESGRLLMMVNTGGDPELERQAFAAMAQRQVDALIYATMYHRVVEPTWEAGTERIALVNAETATGGVWAVAPDEQAGGYTATDLLLSHGHRRIGFVTEHLAVPAAEGRLAGYRQAHQAHDVQLDERLIITGPSDASGGYAGAKALLESQDRPTALFCFNDRIAMGAYRAINELGLQIPADVSVVGFDNLDVIAPWLHPGLTTVALPHYEMGSRAVRHLVALIEQTNELEAAAQYLEPCPLIERASVAAPSP
jgi:LacI family transcriptional regulator